MIRITLITCFMLTSTSSTFAQKIYKDETLLEIVKNHATNGKGEKRCTQFAQLLEKAEIEGLDDCNAGPFTLFASNAKTIRRLGEKKFEKLMSDETSKEELRELLSYSVVPGIYKKQRLRKTKTLNTLLDGPKGKLDVKYDKKWEDYFLNEDKYGFDKEGAWIAKANYIGCNGVLHVINAFLVADDEKLI